MPRKVLVLTLMLLLLVLASCTKTNSPASSTVNDITDTVDALTGIGSVKIKENTDRDLAIAKAKELWRARSLTGENLTNGPCLSDEVIPGWVADIAHSPREAVDDLPENQCSAYRAGTATHFVELDPEGNVIRAE